MKNANYNLIKVLLSELDDAWRINKHYQKDAKEFGCSDCEKILKKIHDDTEKHIAMLRDEIAKHCQGNKFD
jgi:hypothetical protein